MALLRFKNEAPPFGGFNYRQKETALVIHADSLGEATRKVIEHRVHKGLTPTDEPTVQKEIERWICGRLGNNECIAEGQTDSWVPTQGGSNVMDLDKIVGFSMAGWEWLKEGGEFIPIDEAKERADICRDCPSNIDQGHDCFTCALTKLIHAVVPPERRFPDLHSCGHCGCDLVSKVNLSEAAVVASDNGRGIKFPVWCWQRYILAKVR